jgi:glucosamine--fructose-6-phosphate aminotransferase (isomerizing)
MCGIIGYVGKKSSLPVLIDGLKRLEYRGYDSAGISYHNGNGIEVYKTRGKIKDLQEILPATLSGVNVGLGHTRWATHGAPSSRNAHPHTAGGVAVVHNGIIENYRELRALLTSEGQQFASDTDTEVIPQMISMYLKKGLQFREALREAVSQLSGTFAIGAMSETNPHTLFAVRQGSPLVIGQGEGECFLASDVPAMLPYTRRFLFLEDGQMCTINAEEIKLERFDSEDREPLENNIVEVDWTPSMAEKDGYDNFMLKEIYEQPSVLKNTLSEWIEDPLRLLDELGLSAEMIMGLRRLQMVACGTSFHAALISKYIVESIVRIPVDVEIASEYRYKKPIIESGHTLLVSITQSGETADTLAAQREAKDRGARTLTICNVVGSSAARDADAVLYTRAGPEIGVASTKSFTAQMAALCLLAIGLGIRRGRLFAGEANALKSQLSEMPARIEKILKKEPEIRGLAGTLTHASGFLYLGRGINYPVALEGALKLKEISYIHAEGYPAGEMKHGPIALVEEGLPVVVLAPVDNLYAKTLSNIEEVKARGARVIAVTDESTCLKDKANDVIKVPATHPALSAFVNVVPLQLLAYHIAVLKGCDVDQPRNLAKSVTVE